MNVNEKLKCLTSDDVNFHGVKSNTNDHSKTTMGAIFWSKGKKLIEDTFLMCCFYWKSQVSHKITAVYDAK